MNIAVPYRQTSSLAVVSLVSGVLAWVLLPFLGSLVAIITGHMARKEIRNAPGQFDGDGLAIGGLVLGYIQLALFLAGILFLLAVVMFFGGLAVLSR